MTNVHIQQIKLRTPYLVFLGAERKATMAKTGAGLAQWCPELCLGQLRLDSDALDLGLRDLTPQDAACEGAGSLVIGVANVGGAIPDSWKPALISAVESGLDIVAGMHVRLGDFPDLKSAAEQSGAQLIDIRVPPQNLPIGTGKRRTGRRLLTVGTDCATGKKYTALAIARKMSSRNIKSDFRASGQTGIMISGRGIPIDAVVSDFLSGAAECLSPANDADHWDIIEGQGSLFHPGYAAVSLGLLHGSQPDAIVVCHEAHRSHIQGWPDYALPEIQDCIDRNIQAGQLTNREVKCVGVSVNTTNIPADECEEYLHRLSETLDLPCVDPLRGGVGPLVDRIINSFD